MSGRNSRRRAYVKTLAKPCRIAAAAAVAGFLLAPAAQAGNFYWTGDHDSNWNTTGGANGTNWSSSNLFNNDPASLPGTSDSVFFVLFGAGNLNTTLGQDFSINSLNFTSDAVAGQNIGIGGANLLTLGTGGLVDNSAATINLSTNVALGAAQTWTNNSTVPLTVSGVLSGSANLALAGTGAPSGTATGGFVFSGANTYSGQLTLSNAQTSLTLNGNGSLLNVANATNGIMLNAGSSLILDDTGTNSAGRLASTVGITSSGGTLSLLGNATAASAQTVGTLTLGTGQTNVSVVPGSGGTATLTFGSSSVNSFSRTIAGSALNFSSTGTIAAPTVTLDAGGLIGGWATLGNVGVVQQDASGATNALDFATVVGGKVVAASNYVNNNATTDFVAGSNVKVSGAVAMTAGTTYTVNSLYLTGAAAVTLGTGTTTAAGAATLIVADGGIISNAANQTLGGSGPQIQMANSADLGSGTINGTAGSAGGTLTGIITSGTNDLVVTTASNLRIDAVIANNGSTVVNLTKDGSGTLDLSDGNGTSVTNTYTGITTINGGLLVIKGDANLGTAPAANTPNAITLNGGELRMVATITLSAKRGITVGPEGGTISYNGGNSTQLTGYLVTGPGSIQYSDIPGYGGPGQPAVSANQCAMNVDFTTTNYTGGTTFFTSGSSSTNAINAVIYLGASNEVPSSSAVTVTNNDGKGILNLFGSTQSFGSLAGNGNILNGVATTANLTVGGNNLSSTYSGNLGQAGVTWAVGANSHTGADNSTGSSSNITLTKTGTGTLTLSGVNGYTGATTVNAGALLVTGSLAATPVTVSGGSLGGSGTIAGTVLVGSSGHLSPDVTPTGTNTLTIANNLTLTGGATLDYNFGAAGSPGTSDLVKVSAGNALLNAGTDVLNVTALAGFGLGTYDLITVSTGTLTDNATFTINGSTVFNYSVTASGNALVLNVTAGNPNYFWTGGVNGNWDINTTANWTGAGTKYTDGGNVTFDDADLASGGSTNITVTAGGVKPNSIVFNNTTNNFTFGGGAINVTAGAGIVKNQPGSVTFNDAVTTASTILNGGTTTIGAAASLNSTSSVTVNATATLNLNGSLSTQALTLSGTANFNNNVTTTLNALSGASTGVLSLNGTSSLTVSGFNYNGTASVGTGTHLTLNYTTPAPPIWGNFTGGGLLELNSTVEGDWGTPALPAGFTGTLQIDVGHVASNATGSAFGDASAIVIGAGSTAGTGGQLDLSAFTGNFAVPSLTLGGSGYGTGQAAALLLGGTTIANPPALTAGVAQPTIATYSTTSVTGAVNLTGNTTIASNGIAIISGPVSGGSLIAGTSGSPTATNSVPGYPLLVLSNTTGNTYTGTTTVNDGTLQFAHPQDLYNANAASWTASNITVNNGATLALNVGGPNDFTAAQASTILGNLETGTSTGFQPGSAFGVDTSNATGPVAISAPLNGPGVVKFGVGTANFTATANNYSGPTSVANGTLILNGSNTGHGLVSVINTAAAGTSVLSIRNANALGSGSVNSGLAPINMDAYGSNLSAAILEIGAKIGNDPGGNNADFSYQLIQPEANQVPTNIVLANGQISLGFLGNTDDGVGFAAYSTTSTPRVVALYEDPNETYYNDASAAFVQGNATTLAPIEVKYGFGLGGGDHLTLGSSTANTTVVMLNPIDLNAGSDAQRRFASIRGVGTVPEGEYSGMIENAGGEASTVNLSFDGNGGLIFDAASPFSTANIQVNGGAIFVAANDLAQGSAGALGESGTAIQLGTSTAVNPTGGTAVPTTAGANIGFMTYGPNHGAAVSSPLIVTNRPITVGGTGVTYASVVLGGASDDYTAMNGTITLTGNLGSATQVPTTFFARNGGRVDFGGVIGGAGSVVIGGNSVVVEGDANAPGIALTNNGMIVFNGANTYTGTTAVSTGKLYVNGSTVAASAVSVASGATLGGTGTVGGAVTVAAGGNLEGGMAGQGTLTLGGNLSFSGAAAINFNAVQGSLNGQGNPSLVIDGTLATNSNTVTINVLGALNSGNYALIGDTGIQASMFTLATLPSRAAGSLVVANGNELDLDVTSAGGSLLWTGAQSTAWNTSNTNWVLQTTSGATAYIDNPGDAVIFDDTADPKTTVTINNGDVHPGSVTFNNSNTGSTYTVSGANAIAGTTGLTLGSNGGTVVLLNTNTFTGPTVINSGTLQLGNGAAGSDGSISNTASITDNGALIYNIAGSQTYDGIISGSGSLAVKGAGTLILTNNANNYGGTTTITTGTLQLGNGTVNNDGTVPGAVTDNGTLAFDYDGNLTMSSPITGTGAVTKSGAGSLTLANDPNNFSGGLTINAGSLILTGFGNNASGASVGGAGTGLIMINNGGTLQLNPGNGSSVYNLANNVQLNGGVLYSTGSLMHVATGTNQTVNVGAGGGTLETQNTGQDLFIDGQLTGSGPLAISNVANGSSSLVHLTNNANTYSGTVTVNGAVNSGVQLSIDANNAVRTATINLNGTNSSGSTLAFGPNVTAPVIGAITGNGNIAMGALPLTVGSNNATTTYSGIISGTSSLTKAGTGTLSLSNVNTYTGNTNITGGSLKLLAASTGLNEGLVNNATALDTTTPFANWTQVTVQPTARWGASTTSGGTNVYPGWGNNTTWGYAGYLDNTTNAPITYTFGKNFDDDGYLSIDGNILIDDSTYTNAITASVTLSPGLHTLDLLFGQGTGGVGPTGPDYGSFGIGYNTVGNTATSGTWLQFGPTSSDTTFYPLIIGQIANTSSVVMSSNTSFDISGSTAPVTIASLADASANPTGQQVLLGSSMLLTGNDNTNTQFSGVISGTGGNLTKIGTGTFTLLGANTYTGGTTITSGTLDIEPVTGSPTVSSLPANSNVINNSNLIVNAPNTTTSNVTGTGTLQVGAATTSSANLTTASFNQASVTINPGAVLALHGPTQAASVTSQLTQNGNGTLDLGGNGIIVNYTGTSPLPGIQAAIATGTNKGTFAGPYTSAAITSSAAAANTALAIGYGEASTILPHGGTFLGTSVPAGASAVLARTTLSGDANLDGTVNFSDFLVLQPNFNQPGNWSQGDFNGDGVVNFGDFLALQTNFNKNYTATPSVQTAGVVTAGASFPNILTPAAKTSATSSQSAVASSSGSKLSPLISVSLKSAASTPNAGSSSPNASAPTVTYILSINDNGSGAATPGSYAVYAVDSTSDGNGGLVSYEVNVSGAATMNTTPSKKGGIGAPSGFYDDGTPDGNDVAVGFTLERQSSTGGGINTPNLTGSQDTVHSSGPFVPVYNLGQAGGDLANYEPANSAGLDTAAPHTTLQTYGPQILLATGTYSGAAPAFVLNTDGTQNSQGANEWVNTSSTSNEPATIDLMTQTLPAPEPTSLAMLGLAAGGLMLRRRRRQNAQPSVA